MHRISHFVYSTRPWFKAGKPVRIRFRIDRENKFVRKLFGSRMFSLSLLGLVLTRFSPLAGAASVILAWDPSTDPLIAGYSLYYGGASQTYTNEISVGLVTTATLSGLAEGNTYYFA